MQNEILKPVLATDETAIPRYDIVNPDGSVTQQNVELRLKNQVIQEGTPYDEDSVLPAELATQLGLPTTATPAQALQLLATKSYNKDETLSNETKTLFGLGADAVPDDVFNAAIDQLPKIGDIKITTRSDLSDSWLLCNGEKIDRVQYPDVGPICDPNYDKWPMLTPIDTVGELVFTQGIWANLRPGTAGKTLLLKYGDSITNLDNSITIPVSNTVAEVSGIFHSQLLNKWLAFYCKDANNTISCYCLYADSIGGPWTELSSAINSAYNNGSRSIRVGMFSNGIPWVAGYSDDTPNGANYSTDLITWTSFPTTTTQTTKAILADAEYFNGVYYSIYINENTSPYTYELYKSAELTSAGEFLFSVANRDVTNMEIVGNKLFITGKTKTTFYVVDNTGTISTKTLTTAAGTPSAFYFSGRYFIIDGYYKTLDWYEVTDDATAVLLAADVALTTTVHQSEARQIEDYAFFADDGISLQVTPCLPVISVDNAYVYIKAKEGA